MDPGSRSRRTRLLTYGLAALWLALAFVNVARGAAHAGAGYRFWSFQHHCYSDVIALHGDRYLGGGRPLPYLEDQLEYPVLLGAALWLPSFAPGGVLGHFTVTFLFLAACLVAALLALERLPWARPWWLGATPALVYYAALNWDLLPIALMALALLAFARAQDGRAGALAGLGVTAKLFPAVLAPPALAALLARRPRRVLAAGGALVAVLAGLNLPVALWAPEGWSWFFRFNAGRGAENSIWDALRLEKGPLLELASTGPLLVATAFACWAAWSAGRRRDPARAVALGAALAVTVWIATNKIWSPQYALYGFLAGAIAAGPGWLFGLATVSAVADFHIAFEVRARRWEEGFRDGVFHPSAYVRTAVWLLVAAWVARELWREARGGGGVPVPARGSPEPAEGSPRAVQ